MLTLIVDASYCAETRAGGWACWCKVDGQASHVQGGPVTCVLLRDHHEAEMVAVLHGLNVAVQYAPGEDVLLQSDSARSLRMLRWDLGFGENAGNGRAVGDGALRPTETEGRLLLAVRTLLARYPVRVTVRHVSGHKPKRGGRFWCNELCDQMAKEHMMVARAGAHLRRVEGLADQVGAA